MRQNIVSARELQRNYKGILEEARRSRGPVFLGSHGDAKAVILDIEDFKKLEKKLHIRHKQKKWKDVEALLDKIADSGVQSVSLSDFVYNDRRAH